MERVITNIAIEPDGVNLTYLTLPDDLRENGLAAQHQISIPTAQDYGEEIDNVKEAALALLEDALEDFTHIPVYEAPQADDPDDDDEED
jgi:hypothetical protein